MGTFPNPDTQFKPGQSGNPKGMKPGTKHISTWIQDMLNDESFEANILDPKIGIKAYQGAPIQAIITVAVTRALAGEQRWADWLGKYGYGIKTDITTNGESINPVLVKFVGENDTSGTTND